MRFFSLLFPLLGLAGTAAAHTVPTIVIEAVFSPDREVALTVNLDPRLFLSPQPTSLPPVPASWWFDQDEAARLKSSDAARAYIAHQLRFRLGDVPLALEWKVQPIDSAAVLPLNQASAEVHLLAEHRGKLPAVPGDFRVDVGAGCAVAVILLNSLGTDGERRPQSLFPGESSRAFALPAPTAKAPEKPQSGGLSAWTAVGTACVLLLVAVLWLAKRLLTKARQPRG